MIVADAGIVAAGYVAQATEILEGSGIHVSVFNGFDVNPDTAMIERGRAHAQACRVDSLIAFGGGSALDCAKGINFLVSNGGGIADYRGYGKARSPMLPMIGVPTTAGTGSEAQSYAVISAADTHEKMACGDPKAAFRLAILDPLLTVSQPRMLTAVSGYDAISHAVESFVTADHTDLSDMLAREAWRQLEGNYEHVLTAPDDISARGAMQLGAFEAGLAIEYSMLGATHACANPLTARHNTTHGVAIAVMLPHVVRWNAEVVGARYGELLHASGLDGGSDPGSRLADRLDALARAGGLPRTLAELGVPRADLPLLARDALRQWTGTFNPRPLDEASVLALYERAY
jgi:alcohol dehydrogenase